jgi:glycosyltransferase involved in cell wall biosynthesis
VSHPSVSVVISVRDGATYLAAALDSILDQTPPPTEIVVVDDGSRDATPDVLSHYADAVRVVRQERLGLGVALNRGLAETTGAILGFCDADDLWDTRKQERQLAHLAGDPDCPVVGGLVAQFVSPEAHAATAHLRVDRTPTAAAMLGSLLLRRAAVDRIGPFDTATSFATAVDWIARARAIGLATVMLDEVVLLRRVHGANMTVTNPAELRQGLLRALRAQRHRHRDGVPPT